MKVADIVPVVVPGFWVSYLPDSHQVLISSYRSEILQFPNTITFILINRESILKNKTIMNPNQNLFLSEQFFHSGKQLKKTVTVAIIRVYKMTMSVMMTN